MFDATPWRTGAALIFSCLVITASSGCGSPSEPRASAQTEPIVEPPTEAEATGEARLRTVYVPAYSHVQGAPDHWPEMLYILLSVRNMDSLASVTLTHVDYFDTSGHRVRRYLDKPRTLGPLQTAEFLVEDQDDAGGSGANFLVYWEGPSDVHPLLTESLMWGHVGAGYLSFTSRGVELDRRPDPNSFAGPETKDVEPAPTPSPEPDEAPTP